MMEGIISLILSIVMLLSILCLFGLIVFMFVTLWEEKEK